MITFSGCHCICSIDLTDVPTVLDISSCFDGVEVVHLVVDLQVTDAAGEAGVHLKEVIGVAELAGAAQNNGLSKGYP